MYSFSVFYSGMGSGEYDTNWKHWVESYDSVPVHERASGKTFTYSHMGAERRNRSRSNPVDVPTMTLITYIY